MGICFGHSGRRKRQGRTTAPGGGEEGFLVLVGGALVHLKTSMRTGLFFFWRYMAVRTLIFC